MGQQSTRRKARDAAANSSPSWLPLLLATKDNETSTWRDEGIRYMIDSIDVSRCLSTFNLSWSSLMAFYLMFCSCYSEYHIWLSETIGSEFNLELRHFFLHSIISSRSSIFPGLGVQSRACSDLLFLCHIQGLNVPDSVGILIDASICNFTSIKSRRRFQGTHT
jgi:hypothetical protein